MPFLLENKIGRLVEISLYNVLTVEDMTALRNRLWTTLSHVDGRAAIWVDARQIELFSSEVATTLIHMFRVDNPKVERRAYLFNGRASFALQVDRVISEAKGVGRVPPRRTFRDLSAAGDWLKEVLTDPAERQQVDGLVKSG